MVSVDVAVAEPAILGECPLWSDAEQVLYWIDIDGRAIHRLDPSTGVDEQRALPGRPGSLALTGQTGTLLVATEHEIVWFDWASGSVTPWLELEPAGAGPEEETIAPTAFRRAAEVKEAQAPRGAGG